MVTGCRCTSSFQELIQPFELARPKRTGEFTFDGRRYLLRRVLFPENPVSEYFVVDLLQQHDMAGASLAELERGLVATSKDGRWNRAALLEMAERYGTKATLALVERALRTANKAP